MKTKDMMGVPVRRYVVVMLSDLRFFGAYRRVVARTVHSVYMGLDEQLRVKVELLSAPIQSPSKNY